jgi:hypothetical protein
VVVGVVGDHMDGEGVRSLNEIHTAHARVLVPAHLSVVRPIGWARGGGLQATSVVGLDTEDVDGALDLEATPCARVVPAQDHSLDLVPVLVRCRIRRILGIPGAEVVRARIVGVGGVVVVMI